MSLRSHELRVKELGEDSIGKSTDSRIFTDVYTAALKSLSLHLVYFQGLSTIAVLRLLIRPALRSLRAIYPISSPCLAIAHSTGLGL